MMDSDQSAVPKAWYEPPFSDADLEHHRRWLAAHGQSLNPAECPVCAALDQEQKP